MHDDPTTTSRQLALLSGMARLLQCCQDEPGLLDVAQWYLPALFREAPGALFLDHGQTHEFDRALDWGGAQGPPPATPCPALVDRLPMSGARTEADKRCRDCAPGSDCMPLIAERRPIGVLRFAPRQDGGQQGAEACGGDGLRFIAAEHLALAVANLRLRAELRELAMRDRLTGLYNRHQLDEALEREIKRASRLGAPLGLILFDLDHFKDVNDTHGHDAGDAVLSAVGLLLCERLRSEDVACRYGGEEFLVLLAGCGPEATQRRAEDLRRAVAELRIPAPDGALIGPVTLSAGFACWPRHAEGALGLVRAADQALLRAKGAGRDRVLGPETSY